MLLLILPIASLAGLGIVQGADPQNRGGAVLGILGVIGCLLALVGLPSAVQLWLIGSGGPVLALSPAGLWIRTRPTRGQAVWLPPPARGRRSFPRPVRGGTLSRVER
ncbi:hypothetical protein [Polymorphospora rubra]|uniref:hypothetical protein n=1 Tax=Polymorphospora rubra TaxID=338584 RepID=UPI0034061BA6